MVMRLTTNERPDDDRCVCQSSSFDFHIKYNDCALVSVDSYSS